LPEYLIVSLMIVVPIIAAIIYYKWIEYPVIKYLREKLTGTKRIKRPQLNLTPQTP
jgi:peptidoglycan/LPS O-acetylase OafA/YrhL